MPKYVAFELICVDQCALNAFVKWGGFLSPPDVH